MKLIKEEYFLILVISMIIATVISVTLSVGIIRLCFTSDASSPLSLRSLICGNDLNSNRIGFKRLTSEDMFIESGIVESKQYSIDRGYEAAKLVDGDKLTLAAPANRELNYKIIFTEPHRIRQVIIIWGDYGTIGKYISRWKIEASEGGDIWTEIKKGDSPNEKETVINGNFNATAIRLTAESPEEWIGAYELQLVGRPL
jgi:hypothetical protein